MTGDDGELNDFTDDAEIEIPEIVDDERGEDEQTVIGFADDEDEEAEETPLIKKLREQVRTLSRKVGQARPVEDNDPEPSVSDEPGPLSDFEYDEDAQRAAWAKHKSDLQKHGEWLAREATRKESRDRSKSEQARQIDQQKRALGVPDYDDRAAVVQDRLSDAQVAIIINGADNPAQVIYALGRSQARLDMLAGEDNLAKFAVMLGKLEKDIKVSKRKPPAPESHVRGATASTAVTNDDKYLAKLEAEAEKTGDRSKIAAYRRERRKAA